MAEEQRAATPVQARAGQAKRVYIKFFAGVRKQTINALIGIVDQKMKQGADQFVILMSSLGGSAYYGLSAYNYLKGIPAKIVTHNFGSVDSIAAVLFSAGEERYSVPHARFLLHAVAANFEKGSLEEKQIEESLNSLRIDTENIAGVIAACTNKKEEEIAKAMHDRTTLSPEQAKEFGLIHGIKEELIEAGAEQFSIFEP